MGDGRVISSHMVHTFGGGSIMICGHSSQTRSFCVVDDRVEGFIELMDVPPDFKDRTNLGNPRKFNIREHTGKVLEFSGSKSLSRKGPLSASDLIQRQPDITLATARRGWRPSVQLEAKVAKTIEYFHKLLSTGMTFSNVDSICGAGALQTQAV